MQFSASPILTLDPAPSSSQIQTWCQSVLTALKALFENGSAQVDFASLLNTQYRIVTNNAAPLLYHQLTLEINNRVVAIRDKLNAIPPDALIETLSATWKHFIYVLDSLRSFCPHLEQSFVSPGNYFSLSDYALKRWQLYILSNTETLQAISRSVIHSFNVAREGDGKLPTSITAMANMLSLIDPLSNSVSTFYIQDGCIQAISLVCGTRRTKLILESQAAQDQYDKDLNAAKQQQQQQQSPANQAQSPSSLMGDANNNDATTTAVTIPLPRHSYVVDYCNQVEFWVAQELTLCQQILSPATCQRIKTLLLEELIGQADAILIQDPFDGLLYHFKRHNIQQVGLIYHLLTLAQADITIIIDEIKVLIKEEITKIITEANKCSNPIIFVNAIYHLFHEYTQVIRQACYNNSDLLIATQNSIEYVICGSSTAPRLLALYIDQLLHASIQTISLTNTALLAATAPALNNSIKPGTKSQPQDLDVDRAEVPVTQIAATYRNTLDPFLFQSVLIATSPQLQSAIQARHRVFYELEVHIQKWIDLVRFLSDKDVYEENHRLLCVERLLLNIHENYGYRGLPINWKQIHTGDGGNAVSGLSTTVAHGVSGGWGIDMDKMDSYKLRFSSPMTLNQNNSSNGPMRLISFLAANPTVPMFILFEYYLLAQLAAPGGPQIPIVQFESLLRDVVSSANLQARFNLPGLMPDVQTRWLQYVDKTLMETATQNSLVNAATSTTSTATQNQNMDDVDRESKTDAFDPLSQQKTLYPIVEYNLAKVPLFVPTIVTQGVWNNTISPTLPSMSTPTNSTPAQISAHLLTTSHVLYPTLKIPFEVLTLLNLFQERYTKDFYKGRKLVWNFASFTAVISASFKHPELQTIKTYELVCTFLQLLILNLFNHKSLWTYSEIADSTGIINPAQFEESTAQFNSALLSLSHPKVGILKKSPNTPQMAATHQFSWNDAFYSSTQRFFIPKLNATTMRNISSLTASTANKTPGGTVTKTPNVSQQTLFRRESSVDAAIVRLLKQHKELTHSVLIEKVQEMLKHIFVPDESFIKQRIEQQIDLFNIERDSEDRKLYRYI